MSKRQSKLTAEEREEAKDKNVTEQAEDFHDDPVQCIDCEKPMAECSVICPKTEEPHCREQGEMLGHYLG
eukprot:gene16725-5135_t